MGPLREALASSCVYIGWSFRIRRCRTREALNGIRIELLVLLDLVYALLYISRACFPLSVLEPCTVNLDVCCVRGGTNMEIRPAALSCAHNTSVPTSSPSIFYSWRSGLPVFSMFMRIMIVPFPVQRSVTQSCVALQPNE